MLVFTINLEDNRGGQFMKRRVWSMIVTLAMVFSLFSLSAMAADEPFTLDKPTNLTATLKVDPDGVPYFEIKLDIPETVRTINSNLQGDPAYYEGISCDGIEIEFEYKYGQYDWNEGPSAYWNTTDSVTEFVDRGGYWEYTPFDSGDFDTVDIKSEVYSFRARFTGLWGYTDDWIDKSVHSGYSNIATVGNPSFYNDASDWAIPELEKANDAGLIPDILKGTDMTKPITREEFAELAVLLYEKTSGNVAVAVSPNPFTDTTNQQILKAFTIGTTKGTSDTTFSPKVLINREECATMLFRTLKAMVPDGDYSIAGVSDFTDQVSISGWAVESTKYMSKLDIVKGDANGNFMPKATTTAQQAAGYGMATRQEAILMTIRTYDVFK